MYLFHQTSNNIIEQICSPYKNLQYTQKLYHSNDTRNLHFSLQTPPNELVRLDWLHTYLYIRATRFAGNLNATLGVPLARSRYRASCGPLFHVPI